MGKAIDLAAVFLSKLGPWMLAAFVAYEIRASLSTAMGAHTVWAFWIRMMTGVQQVRAFAFIFGMVGLAYGIKERELRLASIERLRRRVAELERRLEECVSPACRGGGR